MKTKDLTLSALLAALICVFAPLSIPVGPVPISLATFAIYIASSAFRMRHGLVATVVYIIAGCFGLPVFSSFTGGFQMLFGVTGGYIWGYVPLSAGIGMILKTGKNRFLAYPGAMVFGTLLLYVCGTAWFMFVSGSGFFAAAAVCVVPFLPGDAVKIAVASLISFKLSARFPAAQVN